ncbi:short-chain dehydrogenase/reductase SDR [Weissella oryzae SG25]|uniref:Short-chain dehydrogenase/reductase SDR n=1 Tax=Weissella oryzae (strain DSM 25784 / JCM 18191 / LMG 30913 / SG25) TaxID=1329250 RepID=A0A069CTX9_WEIOS|nr:short-chain dehydrogenase/reductase SDR [Weissella oryzae SG25]
MTIKNKVVVITGASSGIGAATAKLLANRGAKLVLGARREGKLVKLVDEIRNAGGQAVYAITDVTKAEDSQHLVDLAKSEFGRFDVIFLNAGLMPSSNLSELKVEEWNQMVDVNLKGVLNGIAAALPAFIKQKSGQVIATSSVAGLKAYPAGELFMAQRNGLYVI